MLRHPSPLHRDQNSGHSRFASSARRHGLFSDGVILLHVNATQHSARVTQQLIESLGWGQMNHTLYRLHLFLHLKLYLSGQRFDDGVEVRDAVTS
ncbi:hypothetical protein AVEN_75361-1 [Araneus ventricosus]|uniref:Uncharacterized protein n=1 Tax=Araneus ventricosus TaxID=182803 RepID=A0A4Y2SSA8_ARAVE|nr:hypothetical protein AVEN_75361-1 [Araneus ventricosus]